MERTATFSKSNSPREHAALIASLQLIGPLTPTTRAYGAIANVPANLTTASQFIVLQGTTNVTEDTSGSGVSFVFHFNLSSSGEATETHIRYGYDLFALPFGNLGYPEVQFSYQPGSFVLKSTPTIKELLNGPLFQAAGMFEINEPGWADKHDEYIAETYL